MSGADRANDVFRHAKGIIKESLCRGRGRGIGDEELTAERSEEIQNVRRRNQHEKLQGHGLGDDAAGRSKTTATEAAGEEGRHRGRA